jgi:sortase A
MKISTLLVIFGMIIITLYLVIDVDYYSSTDNSNGNFKTSAYIKIPKIGADEPINNKSISYGVYHEPKSSYPGLGTFILYGHRTLYGAPFANIDKLKLDDKIVVGWYGIGDVEYKVTKSFIVPSSSLLSLNQGKVLFLVTCYPPGSTKERLIVEAQQQKIYPFQDAGTNNKSNGLYALLLIGSFFAVGTVLSYIYPIEEDKQLIFYATIILALFLILGFLFPIPADFIASGLTKINVFLGI